MFRVVSRGTDGDLLGSECRDTLADAKRLAQEESSQCTSIVFEVHNSVGTVLSWFHKGDEYC